MKILRWMSIVYKNDLLKNKFIRDRLGMTSIFDELRDNRLKWYEHVLRRLIENPIKKRMKIYE